MIWKKLISFLSAAIIILATLPVFVPAPAQAWFPHGTAGGGGGGCAYAIDNGCAAAPANGELQSAALLISAQQSGQNSLLPGHPMNFNIPCVDYACGPDKTLTPTDPRNFNDGVCAWDAASGGRILCGGSGLYHEVLNNIDFCGSKIGKSPAYIYLNSDIANGQNPQAGSTVTITNSYFCPPSDPGGVGQNVGVYNGYHGNSNWSLTYKNNKCVGTNLDPIISGFCLWDIQDAPGTTIDVEYNDFSDQGKAGRIINGMTNASLIFKYNFVEGLNKDAPDPNIYSVNHAEISERNCSAGRVNCNPDLEQYEGNFIIWDTPTYAGINNVTFYLSDGEAHGVRFNTTKVINNVVVSNSVVNGSFAPDIVLVHANAVASIGNLTVTGNWVDATGTGTGISLFGDKSTDGTGVHASQSGTVITITSFDNGGFGNNPIEPGWQFFRGGVKVATITSFGTGLGNTGTYNVDTTATIASDALWTLVPGYGTVTQSDNHNMNDPSHTGMPTSFTMVNPDLYGFPVVK